MKNYRGITPIALLVLMAMSIYSLFSSYSEKRNKYEYYVSEARNLAEEGITKDSIFMYQEALEISDTVALRLEAGQIYKNAGEVDAAISWGEKIIQKYPVEAAGYEFLLDLYMQKEDYISCFELQDQLFQRKITSAVFDERMNAINYHYELGRNKFTEVSDFEGSMCAVYKDETWGYVDEMGALQVTRQYAEAGAFAYSVQGKDYVLVAPVQETDGDRYYINWKGDKKYVVKNLTNCTYLGPYSENVLVAAENDIYAYYDIDFSKLSTDYSYASTMYNGMAVVQIGEKWNIINNKFEIVGNAYDGFVEDSGHIVFKNKRAFGKLGDAYYLVDETGNTVSDVAYEDAKTFSVDEYAAVKKNGKWGFIDTSGEVILEAVYEDAYSFCIGLAPVKKDGKWGFINTDGDVVIDCQFEDAKGFNEWGNAFVKVDGNWILLSLTKYNH